MLVLDAVLTGAKGLNLWSSFRVAAAAAQRAALSRARRARPRVLGLGRAAADRAAVPLHRVGDRDRRRCRSRSVEERPLEELDRCRADGHHRRRSWPRRRRSCERGWSSTTTASPTSRTSSATSRPIAAVDLFDAIAGAHRGRHAGRGRRRGARRAAAVEPDGRLVRSAAGRRRRDGRVITPVGSSRRIAHRSLDNGVVVLGKQTRTTPAVTINLAVRAGIDLRSGRCRRARPGCSRASSIAGTGARGRPTTIAEELDGRGITLTVTSAATCCRSSAPAWPRTSRPCSALLADIVMAPALPDDEIATRQGRGRHRHPPGRGQSRPCARPSADGAAVPGRASVRPAARRARFAMRRALDARAARCGCTPRASRRTQLMRGHRRRRRRRRASGSWRRASSAGGAAPAPPPIVAAAASQPARERRRLVIPMMNKSQADIAYGFTTIARAIRRTTRSG